MGPPVHIPLRLVACILSRVRSEIVSRSICAKTLSTPSIARPAMVSVSKACVIDTNAMPFVRQSSTVRRKSIWERLIRSNL
jgi:hypothetical protein